MRESWIPALKALCAVLAVLLVLRAGGALTRLDPLKRATVPEPPSWAPAAEKEATNTPAAATPPGMPPGMAPGMPPGMPMAAGPRRGGRGGGGPGPALPPEVQARVDRVIQSEILGQIIRPPPMALLGIAGQDVFLRAPNGQSGLVREGGELGGVQLLKIGTNRVLVKENGETKELMIFEGIGGESLMPRGKEGSP